MHRDSLASLACTTSGGHPIAVMRPIGEGKITLTARTDEREPQQVTIDVTGVSRG